jgi:regulatory protein
MPVVTLLERQQKHKDRVNVYLDGEFAFGLNELDAATLRKGQLLSDEQVQRLREQDEVVRAVDTALRLLSLRPRSHHEIRHALAQKSLPAATIHAALTRLEAAGYVDDAAFARYWIDQRTRFQPRGARALRYELRQKGLDPQLIEAVLSETPAAAEAEAAESAARAGLRRLRGSTRQVFRQKLGALLQRRGFSYHITDQVIRRLTEELAAAQPPFFATGHDED